MKQIKNQLNNVFLRITTEFDNFRRCGYSLGKEVTNIKLKIIDRLNINTLFPQMGDLVTQILVKGIKTKVEIESDEASEIKLRQEGEQIKWDATKAQEKDIQFNDAELKFLQEQVKTLDQEKRVTPDNVGLCVAIQDATKDLLTETK